MENEYRSRPEMLDEAEEDMQTTGLTNDPIEEAEGGMRSIDPADDTFEAAEDDMNPKPPRKLVEIKG